MWKSMSVLAAIGLVDSISYMAVGPSLVFYVMELGGSKEEYGLIMSAFSFASFCSKPFFGTWVDRGGNKFRTPYLASFSVAILGALVYMLAVIPSTPRAALAMALAGRLMSGIGAANQALGFAYIASVIPADQQTKTNSLLAMTRIGGMTIGPVVNVFLSKIDTSISFFGFGKFPLNPLNSVGLLLAVGNLFVGLFTYFMLAEPPEKPQKVPVACDGTATCTRRNLLHSVCCIEIVLPLFILFVVNSDFQLVETALPPAAADGLGWGPVATSALLGSTMIVVFAGMCLTLYLSGTMSDTALTGLGLMFWVVGGFAMYFGWVRNAPVWHYVVPVMIACAGFPFIASSNRSNFSKSVASKPELDSYQALMQSILSMAASVGGFVTPGFVGAFVIRTPEQVDASPYGRELTPMALYVPILAILVLFGLYRLHLKEKAAAKAEDEGLGMPPDESTSLVDRYRTGARRSSVVAVQQILSVQAQVARRMSAGIEGITAFDTKEEIEAEKEAINAMDEWRHLAELEFQDEEDVPR